MMAFAGGRYIPDPTGSNILCVSFTNFDKAKVGPHPPVVEGDLWTARAVGILHKTRPLPDFKP